MANKPFEYRIINPLERPKSEDLNIAQGQAHYDVRQFAYEIFGRQQGFLGYSFNPEALSPLSGLKISLQQGVAFQDGLTETAIGAIPGLNDSYVSKAVNTSLRVLDVTTSAPNPAGVNAKRYDLIQIRAPKNAERLTQETATDILNPTLQSFSSPNKYKTLTSSLDGFDPVYTNVGAAVTTPFSYVSGAVTITTDWGDVVQPPVSAGYLGVAYIKRYTGQVNITSADIIDARTKLTLPTMVGGTATTLIAADGAVAYSDGTKLAYAEPPTVFTAPIPGRILVSGSSGVGPQWLPSAELSHLLVSGGLYSPPIWLAPGTEGQVLTSTGTAWAAQDVSALTTFAAANVIKFTTASPVKVSQFDTTFSGRKGVCSVGIQPRANEASYINCTNNGIGAVGYIFLRLRIFGTGLDTAYTFNYYIPGPPSGIGFPVPISYPNATLDLPATQNYNVELYLWGSTTLNIQVEFQDCDLVISQG